MGKVVNLNQFRKKKARAEKQRRAEQNRVEHGMTKTERDARTKQRTRDKKKLDDHLLDDE